MNKSGLVLRLAIVLIITAVAVGFATSKLVYQYSFKNEQAAGEQRIHQLYKTVLATASIAGYLNDESLAEEVINGLVTNDVIMAAAIQSDHMFVKSKYFKQHHLSFEFPIFSPFEKDRRVGSIFVNADAKFIMDRADNLSSTNAFVMAIILLIITLISLIVCHYIITKPILNIGAALHLISPGTYERVQKPKLHKKSEIGILTEDINELLDKAAQQLRKEKLLRDEVEVLEAKFRMLFESSTSAIALVADDGEVLLYNETFKALIEKLNLPHKDNYGVFLEGLFINKAQLHKQVTLAIENQESASVDLELMSNEEEASWVRAVITTLDTTDERVNYQITLHDISKQKHQLTILDQQANYDSLTQLLNRQAAETRLKQFISEKSDFAFIMMDLNGFKPINDKYGHDAGDEILMHVARQLEDNVRKADMLARWGGDEFVIALPNVDKTTVVAIAEKLIARIAEPYYLGLYDKEVSVGASMGVCFYPDNQSDLLKLIRAADKAMYRVKKEKAENSAIYLSFSDEESCIVRKDKSNIPTVLPRLLSSEQD